MEPARGSVRIGTAQGNAEKRMTEPEQGARIFVGRECPVQRAFELGWRGRWVELGAAMSQPLARPEAGSHVGGGDPLAVINLRARVIALDGGFEIVCREELGVGHPGAHQLQHERLVVWSQLMEPLELREIAGDRMLG